MGTGGQQSEMHSFISINFFSIGVQNTELYARATLLRGNTAWSKILYTNLGRGKCLRSWYEWLLCLEWVNKKKGEMDGWMHEQVSNEFGVRGFAHLRLMRFTWYNNKLGS